MYRIATAIAFVLLLTSCATTRMSSYVDPNYDGAQYTSVMVISNLREIGQRQYIEARVCEELTESNVTCIRGIDVFPPTQDEITDEEFAKRIIATNVEALLIIQFTDAFTQSAYIPQTSTTTGTANTYGSGYGSTTYLQSNTTTTGGFTVSKPREKNEVTVFDVNAGQKVLVASTLTKGNAYADLKTMSNSLAATVVEELVGQGMIPAPPE